MRAGLAALLLRLFAVHGLLVLDPVTRLVLVTDGKAGDAGVLSAAGGRHQQEAPLGTVVSLTSAR